VLNQAESALVSIFAGSDLTMAEVNRVMSQINRACENTHIIMGAAVEADFGDRLSVTVIATRRTSSEEQTNRTTAGERVATHLAEARPAGSPAATEASPAFGTEFFEKTPPVRPTSRYVPPPPELTRDKKEQLLAQQTGKTFRPPKSKMRQGMLPLEIVSKGRFDKSEPTIHHGEDLDVPTYIRRGVPLN